jgi:hypoxanthine phosphoribosyltransferase
MQDEIKLIQASAEQLYSEDQVDAAISNMAAQITDSLADRNPLILCVMNGGIVTTGKILTQLNFPLTLDAINASRYQNQTVGNTITWHYKPSTDINGRTVLIIDDILDKGITLQAVHLYCQEHGATAIYSAVLIDKQLGHPKPIQANFVGLETENRYLFGSGMDYKGYLRNAPGIFACAE